MIITKDEILAKHPGWTTIFHGPKPECKYCKGTGERTVKLHNDQQHVGPCICLFVEHEWVDLVQTVINQAIQKGKQYMKPNLDEIATTLFVTALIILVIIEIVLMVYDPAFRKSMLEFLQGMMYCGPDPLCI